jgi:predicted  nucleic acid-binding Zn-ribbon protein
MATVAATQMPAARFSVDWTPVRDTLAALRAGQESLDLFVGQLFSGLESMHERLDQHDRRLKEERRQIAEQRERLVAERAQWEAHRQQAAGEGTSSDQRTLELEQDRRDLEEELETVRARCEELAGTVAEQKRQIAEERAEWTAEFRQLRKILDKQSQLLAQKVEQAHVAQLAVVGAPAGPAQSSPDRGGIDPVLGSVMSQFQLLQKDAARRRAQARNKAS